MTIKVLDTNLELREMTDADYKVYVDQVIEQGEVYLQYGYEPSDDLIEAIRHMNPDVIYYSIYDSASNALVGYVGITPESGNLELYVFKDYRNKGYGTAAAKCFAEAYLEGKITGKAEEEVVATTLSENLASIRLLEKAGFAKEAVGWTISMDDAQEFSVTNTYRAYRLAA